MADNRFKNDEFEDIFSNSSDADKYEDIYSSSDDYEDVYSVSEENEDGYDEYFNDDFTVKYNSAVQNRRRQEIEYEDIGEVFSGVAPESRHEKKGKKHTARNALLAFLCVVLVLVSCVGFYGFDTVKKLLSSFDTEEQIVDNEYISENLLYASKEQINVLLVGVDAREGESESRSDTMILVTLDNKNKEIKLTSFLRDTYVEIAGRNKKEKLNAAYFRGGAQTLIDTLEMNFKISIPYYVVVDFEIFTTIVDALGGVNVDVTEKESRYSKRSDNGEKLVPIEAGEDILLNGEQALWYARMRKLDSDFMRTQRQRKVISAIVEKAKTQDINALMKLAETIIPLVKTNLSANEIMKTGASAFLKQVYSYPIVQQQIPAEGTWSSKNISGVGSSLVMNDDENVKILQSFLSERQTEEVTTTK